MWHRHVFFGSLTLATALAACGDGGDCISQCELAAGVCYEEPFESFGDVEDGREAFRARCDDGVRYAFEGRCEDDTVVLRSGTGVTSEGRFYDAESGEFLGLTTTTDVWDTQCSGKGYWPEPIPCGDPVVEEVWCGDTFDEGDPAGAGVTQ